MVVAVEASATALWYSGDGSKISTEYDITHTAAAAAAAAENEVIVERAGALAH